MPAVKRSSPVQKGRAASPSGPGLGDGPKRTLIAAAAALLVGGGLIAAASGGRAHAVAATLGRGVDNSFAGLGFRVERVQIKGASPFAERLIAEATGLSDGQPILGVDLSAMRERIEKVGYVRDATVQRLFPDTIAVSVKERPRLAVWQHDGLLGVIDDAGRPIPEANPALFPALPMVVGEGANEAAHDVLPLVEARPRLFKRLEALVRVDGRRWDMRLKDGSLIQLPSTGEDAALIELDQLDQRSRVLELGFERIDLRDPEMVAVRPRGQPAPVPAAYAPKPVEPAVAPTFVAIKDRTDVHAHAASPKPL